MNHNYCYDTNSSKHDRDKKMLSNLKNSKSKRKIAKNLIVQQAFNMKYKLGLGSKNWNMGLKPPRNNME